MCLFSLHSVLQWAHFLKKGIKGGKSCHVRVISSEIGRGRRESTVAILSQLKFWLRFPEHHNIVSVFGVIRDQFCIIMELAECSLAKVG
jgi:hypothetical protein